MKPRSLDSILAPHRPPGAPAREAAALAEIAGRWRVELAEALAAERVETLAVARREIDDLAVAITELAEDLHTDNGLWRAVETTNRALFGTPLPSVSRAGDAPPASFDAQRFQFFLQTLWRHFKPDRIVSPAHHGLVAVAQRAATFFPAAFATVPRESSIADFLGATNTRG
jgi:hypothetical protein